MSLLNDALRKNDRENRSPVNVPGGPPWNPVPQGSRRRLLWLIGMGSVSLLVLALVIGGIIYSFETTAGTSLAPSPAVADAFAIQGAPGPAPAEGLTPEAGPDSEVPPSGLPAPDDKMLPATILAKTFVGKDARPTAPPAETIPNPDGAPMSDSLDPFPSGGDDRHHANPNSTASVTAGKIHGADTGELRRAAARPAQTRRYYRKALSYHRQGRVRRAIRLYRQVVQMQPLHFEARFNLVSAYIQIGEFSKAHRIATDLHRREPGNQQVLSNLAIAKIGLGQSREALQLLDRVADLPQASLFTVYLHRGIACRNLGQLDAALGWYKKAEALKPDRPQVLFNLALVNDAQQQYADAVHYYQAYLQHGGSGEGGTEKDIRQRIKTLRAYLAQAAPQEQTRQ